jgi:hypothetical protein
MNGGHIAPQSQQIELALAQSLADPAPPFGIRGHPGPGAVSGDRRQLSKQRFEHAASYPSRRAT